MKRKRYTLIYDYFDEFGDYGYRLQGMSNHSRIAPISTSTQLAHDIVEHINGLRNIGDPLDEIEALGVYLNIRYYHTPIPDMYDAVAIDILEMVRSSYNEYEKFYLKRNRLLTKHPFFMEMFEEVKDRLLKRIRSDSPYLESDLISEILANLPDFLLTVRNHLINGAVKAERKYGSFINAADFFDSIASSKLKDLLNSEGEYDKITFYVEDFRVTDIKTKGA